MQVGTFGPGPRWCPYGHRLTPGNVLVGWSPCICSAATDARRRGLWGHRTYTCWECHQHAITSVCYDPPHVGGGHSERAGARPPQGRTQRAEPGYPPAADDTGSLNEA
ncbi:hypothetical protein GCM10023088_78460 [Actinomadura verrucosospora]